MKEFEGRPVLSSVERLTRNSSNSTLRGEGIPMAEQGEGGPQPQGVEAQREEYRRQLKETTQKSWDKWTEEAQKRGSYNLTPEEEKGKQILINAGKMPLIYGDARVQQIADALNRELVIYARAKIKSEDIRKLEEMVFAIKDLPEVNTQEAEKLWAELQRRRREAERRAPVKKTERIKGLTGKETPEELRKLLTAAGFNEDFLKSLPDEYILAMAKGAAGVKDLDREDRFGFYLTRKDLEILKKDPMSWLEKQLDTIYRIADEGQDLNSPVVNNVQTVWTEAVRYLQDTNINILSEFTSSFLIRLHAIFMRNGIDHRSMENAKEMSQKLRAHGLLTALTFEGGRVHKMFTRLNDFLETMRLSEGGIDPKTGKELFHVDPTMLYRLEKGIRKEQFELALKGTGYWGEQYLKMKSEGKTEKAAREAVQNGITRATRTAFDIFTISQRQAVLVARGHPLTTTPTSRFMSDPIGVFNFFNQEDLLTGKFGLLSIEEEQEQDEIKLTIAEDKLSKKEFTRLLSEGRIRLERERHRLSLEKFEKYKRDHPENEELLDYGKRGLRDIYVVPDFFSSGWRIEGFQTTIEAIFKSQGLTDAQAKEKAKDFGIFLRLKGKREEKGAADWQRVAEIMPEEIIRLYRERARGDSILEAKLQAFFEGSTFDGFRESDAFKTYDKFKKELGPLVNFLRQRGYDNFRALKIGTHGFTFETAERKAIVKYFTPVDGIEQTDWQRKFASLSDIEKVSKIQVMFTHFTQLAKDPDAEVIKQLLENEKFEDIYTRVMVVDDILLEKLENPTSEDVTPISKLWAGMEIGGDALVRNFNDMENGNKALSAHFKFLEETDPQKKVEAAITASESATLYSSQDIKGGSLKYTLGTYFKISKIPFFWDVIGVRKLPFRKAMTREEEIRGPIAQNFSMDEIRLKMDELRKQFASSKNESGLKFLNDVEKMLNIKGLDFAKHRALSFFIFLTVIAMVESYKVTSEAVGLKAA